MFRKNKRAVLAVIAIMATAFTTTGCEKINQDVMLVNEQEYAQQVCEKEESVVMKSTNVVSTTVKETTTEVTKTSDVLATTTVATDTTTSCEETTMAESTTTIEETTAEVTEVPRQEEYVSISIYPSMDINTPTGMSEQQFVNQMSELPYDYTGYFERNSSTIWNLCQTYAINEIAFVGIIAQESGWAQFSCGYNNYFGVIGESYSSEQEGLENFAKLLGVEYLSQNGAYFVDSTLYGVEINYCANSNWADAVYGCMLRIV